jgi:predicted phage-related endonuclease
MTTTDSGTDVRGEAPPVPAKPSVDLPEDATNWLALIRQCDRDIKDLEETKKLARARIEQMLGDAETGLLNGQPVVHWTFVSSRRLDQKKLKDQAPDLVEACTVTQLSRRFTLATDGT